MATSVVMASAMAFGLSACSDDTVETMKSILVDADNLEQYYAQCQEIYDDQLGEFYEAYQKATAITGSSDEELAQRYALMAVSEAKLLESAVFVPTTSNGGNYAISKLAPHTYTYTLWGNDSYRFHQALVTTEFITTADREHINEMYSEGLAAGLTGDEFNAEVREYLEGQGYTIKRTYDLGYAADPTTFDVLATSNAVDSEILVNTYDGLMEYDEMGILQPAIAESYDVSDDGLTYTFHLRDDVSWYNRSSAEVDNVTADDFVAGFQHMLDAEGGLEYLVDGLIVNASEYIAGTLTDFSQVGVKALDDYTLEYTLEKEASYFPTMLAYGVFAPMNREYFISQGGAFGKEAFTEAQGSASYSYGISADTILYCGPYLITNYSASSTIQFSAYDGYYNRDHINLDTITWHFNDGTNDLQAYNQIKDGTLDGAGLNDSALQNAKTETTTDLNGNSGTYYDLFGYVSTTDATTFMAFYNLNRMAYANYNDGTTCASQKTPYEALRSHYAFQNVHFRRALSFAFDRETFKAQSVGDDLALTSLRNSYTPGTFVQLPADVTIDINGTATTFEAGTYYGEIVQAQIDADGVAITAWDPDADGGVGSSDGFDGWYNAEAAAEELEIAIKELAMDGIVIDENNPIVIDYVYVSSSTVYVNRANAYKQSLETALNGLVRVNLVAGASAADWYYSGYYPSAGHQMNYDMNDVSGWAPDYGDPSSYLDTFLPETGYMDKGMGLW